MATTLEDFRAQYPQYNDLSDNELANAIHRRFYSDLDYDEFSERIGLSLPRQSIREAFERGARPREIAEDLGTRTADILPELTLGQRVRNDARLMGDAAVGIVRGVPQAVTDVAGTLANPIGAVANLAVPGDPFSTDVSGDLGRVMTDLGVPEIETAGGRAANQVTRAFGSMFVGQAAANRIANLNATTASRTRDAMSASQAPTPERLRQLADDAYQAAEDANVNISSGSFQALLNRIGLTMQQEGFNARLHPRVEAGLRELQRANGQRGVTFRDFELLRRVVKNAAASTQPDERRVAQAVLRQMDDFVGGLSATDVTAGNANLASTSIRAARGFWTRLRKSETIGELFERAKNRASQFSQSGMENALRTEFRSLAQNERMMRTFTEAERNAIQAVARGGPLVNGLRAIGKFSPHGVVQTALGGGIGYTVAGGPGVIATLTAGELSRIAARTLTTKAAREAYELMLRGEPLTGAQAKSLDPLISGMILGGTSQVQPSVSGNDEQAEQ